MRGLLGLLLGGFLLALAPLGCGPQLSEDELGTVIYDAEELPGADEPYILPEESPDEPEPKPDRSDEPEATPEDAKRPAAKPEQEA